MSLPAVSLPAVTLPAPAPAAPSGQAAPAEADPAQEAATQALPGELLATSKRMAGAIDRELRNGSSPITAEPDRKWERFAAMVAGARTGNSSASTLESHTGADGVIVYRKTVGGRVRCYISGSVGGIGPADGRSAGSMRSCPTGVGWTRH